MTPGFLLAPEHFGRGASLRRLVAHEADPSFITGASTELASHSRGVLLQSLPTAPPSNKSLLFTSNGTDRPQL